MGGHSIRGSTGDKTWSLVVYFYDKRPQHLGHRHDSTISETVMKSEASEIQKAIDELATQTSADKFQLNETKCKELRITFSLFRRHLDPIKVNGQDLECVKYAKILGLQYLAILRGKTTYPRS